MAIMRRSLMGASFLPSEVLLRGRKLWTRSVRLRHSAEPIAGLLRGYHVGQPAGPGL